MEGRSVKIKVPISSAIIKNPFSTLAVNTELKMIMANTTATIKNTIRNLRRLTDASLIYLKLESSMPLAPSSKNRSTEPT